MLRSCLALLAAFLLLLPAGAAGGIDPHAPVAVAAIQTGNVVLVEWTPGALAPDYYNVYGVENGARTLLETELTTDHAQVEGGFATYEVTAVTGGVESAAMVAVELLAQGCHVDVDDGPPPSVNVDGCTPTAPGGPMIWLSLPWSLLP